VENFKKVVFAESVSREFNDIDSTPIHSSFIARSHWGFSFPVGVICWFYWMIRADRCSQLNCWSSAFRVCRPAIHPSRSVQR